MLSQKATDFNIALCEKIEGANFVILSWEDIFSSIQDIPRQEADALFEELRLNACINLKYKDEEQACFAMTDKARLIEQEIKAILNVDEAQETLVKTDEEGNAVLVVPKTQVTLKNISSKKRKDKWQIFWIGFLGGAVSSAIFYAIIYLIEKLI